VRRHGLTGRQVSVPAGLLVSMSTALHLARIERLCCGELSAEHGRPEPDPGGPGYRIAELNADRAVLEEDPAPRDVMEEQYEAERDGLTALLTARWGEPHLVGLGGVLLRTLEDGEEIPEPWASLSARVPDVHVWHTAGRWVALGVARLDPAQPPRLLAAVTDIDPP
jgi:hypothetical protein